ncbi:sigma-54-dependent Fis family transcriptional regulator [candidate division KSB1 bacterium]|nr:sigma-54-dependent Fis family transcriptional regulator [candidate division KSB1 bacterium]
MSGILFVHQAAEVSNLAQKWLQSLGHQCRVAGTGAEATQAIIQDKPQLVFLEIDLPNHDGFDLLQCSLAQNPDTPVILMTVKSDFPTAVRAIKSGAEDFVLLPLSQEKIRDIAAKYLPAAPPASPSTAPNSPHNPLCQIDHFLGDSPLIQKIKERVIKVARTDANVFIWGESGTGKELIAKSIHHYSERRDHAFIPLDCVALPSTLLESELFGYEKGAFTGAMQHKPGLIELADGGTLFLDEITELDLFLQVKLLRVIQERQFRRIGGQKLISVDIRIISASNRNPEKAVEQKALRQDLFFRLHVVPIILPPLRERKQDIPLLLNYFLKQYTQLYRFKVLHLAPETLKVLQSYSWPGNVRELQNIAERLVSLADKEIIYPEDLPESLLLHTVPLQEKSDSLNFKDAKELYMRQFFAQYFSLLLKKHNGNISEIAREAELSRSTIYKILNETHLQNNSKN